MLDEADSKMEEVLQDLQASKSKVSSLEKELAERGRHIERLEAEARSQRKRWLDESREQLQMMNSLRAEVEAKANNIAYLTTELHRLKQKSRNSQTSMQEAGTQFGVAHVPPGVAAHAGYLLPNSQHLAKRSQTYHHHYIPVPPRDKLVGSVPRFWRFGHNKPSSGMGSPGKPVVAVHPPPADALMAGLPNPFHPSSSHFNGLGSPDITPFLPQSKEKTIQMVGVKQAPVLPPIPVSSASSSSSGSSTHPVLVHQVISSASQHRQKKPSPPKTETAFVTLAVENAATADAAWSFAHESRSSEYN